MQLGFSSSPNSFIFVIFSIIESTSPFGTTATFGGLLVNGFPAPVVFDGPTAIICSQAEYEAEPSSTELQKYRDMGVREKILERILNFDSVHF